MADLNSVEVHSVELSLREASREARAVAKRALRGVRQRPNRPLGPLAQAGVLRPGARVPERPSNPNPTGRVSDGSDESAL